ncbi:hypothetical protein [Streptomyces atroolivaceus]|uniref:hypothetical protein n=1 Tax=Streptomyces atroolivaceus TaxID=66869 RepID=UPI00379DEEDC
MSPEVESMDAFARRTIGPVHAAARGVSPDLAAPAVARHPGPDRMLIPEAVVLLIA